MTPARSATLVSRCMALVLAATSCAHSAVIHVSASAPSGGNGAMWSTAFNSLQNALAVATADDQIWIRRGVYTPTTTSDRSATFSIPSRVQIFGGFAGAETMLAQRPADPNPAVADPAFDSILSGEIGDAGAADNSLSVVTTSGVQPGTVLDRLVITAGASPSGAGAGVSNVGGAPTIRDSLITGNTAFAAAGMFNDLFASVTLERVIFSFNSATGSNGRGGAVINNRNSSMNCTNCTFESNTSVLSGGGVNSSQSSASFTDCIFHANTNGDTGAAIALFSGTYTITGCTFTNNSTGSDIGNNAGGAIQNQGANLTVTNSTFTGNSSRTGGAVSDQGIGSSSYTGCMFQQNTALISGGAAQTFSASAVSYTDCTFRQNTSGFGGAANMTNAAATFTRCTFDTNTASGGSNTGGAAVAAGASGNATFSECTFLNNSSGLGGAVGFTNSAQATIDRCTFRGNSASSGGAASLSTAATARFTNCVINANTAQIFGSAIYGQGAGSTTIINCTVVNNSTGSFAPLQFFHQLEIRNTIARSPGAPSQIFAGSTVTVSRSNVLGGFTGTGNIDADPLFVDQLVFNFQLRPGSPCIDAGENPALPPGALLDFNGDARRLDDPAIVDTGVGPAPVVDIGADERRAPATCPGDANADGMVTFPDITSILTNFNNDYRPGTGPGDANRDGIVSFPDITSVLTNFGDVCQF